MIGILTVVALVALLLPVLYIRDTVADFDGKTISVRGAVADVSIPVSKLRSAELRNEMKFGDIVKAASNGYKISGTFKNSEFGEYTASADIEQNKFIVIRYGGSTLVFNLKNAVATEAFYRSIKDSVPSRTGSSRDVHP